MVLQLLKTVHDDTGIHTPGTIMEFSETEAKYLLKNKAAVVIESPTQGETDEKVSTQGETEEVTIEQVLEELTQLSSINTKIAETLVENEVYSIKDLSKLSRDKLISFPHIGEATADKILSDIKGYPFS